MNRVLWVITWRHSRGGGASAMEDTLASTRREAWRKCFNWYVDGHAPGTPGRHEYAALYSSRRSDGTHRAVKVKLAQVTP